MASHKEDFKNMFIKDESLYLFFDGRGHLSWLSLMYYCTFIVILSLLIFSRWWWRWTVIMIKNLCDHRHHQHSSLCLRGTRHDQKFKIVVTHSERLGVCTFLYCSPQSHKEFARTRGAKKKYRIINPLAANIMCAGIHLVFSECHFYFTLCIPSVHERGFEREDWWGMREDTRITKR